MFHFGYSVQLNPGVVQIAVCYAEGDALDSRDMTRMAGELRRLRVQRGRNGKGDASWL